MKYRKPRILLETKLRVVTDYNSGMKVDEIAARNRVSIKSIYRIIKIEIGKEVKHGKTK